MTPTKRITDPTFEYVDAANTDIRKRFARVRKELAQEAARVKATNVQPINKAMERKA